MTTKTLILTRDFSPHKVVPWDRAVTMLFQGKIRVVEEYMSDDAIVGTIEPKRHSDFRNVLKALGARAADEHVVIRTPSVASLIRPVGSVKRGVKFSRINVFTRDRFTCQYCGERKKMAELNYDHVIPRIRGGKTDWLNIVASCYPCNDRKGSRTVQEAGMKLRRQPYEPETLPMVGPRFDPKEIPPNWLQYVVCFLGDVSTAVA